MKLPTAVRHKMQKMTALLLILTASLFLLIGVGQFIHRGITQLEAQASEIKLGLGSDKVAKVENTEPSFSSKHKHQKGQHSDIKAPGGIITGSQAEGSFFSHSRMVMH